MTKNFVERFAEGLTARLQFSKLLGLFCSEVGGLNRVVMSGPMRALKTASELAGRRRKTGKWPPKTQEFIVTQENKIIQPAPFSPPLPESKLGELYEFRTYTYQPGTMPTVLERFGKVMPRARKSRRWFSPGIRLSDRSINIFMFGHTKTAASASACGPKHRKPWKVGRRRPGSFWSCRKTCCMTPAPARRLNKLKVNS